MKTYDVLRQHYGDKPYAKGDMREANPFEVRHLVDAGVLRKATIKAENPTANKAEKGTLKNKGK